MIKNHKFLTSFDLKLIAIITMTIDHIGYLFFPNKIIFRIIGRISFPIFAFLLIEGFKHTKSKTNYLLRLLLFAIISEPIYNLAMHHSFKYFLDQNILFELSLGLIMLIVISKLNDFIKEKDQSNIKYIFIAIGHLFVVFFFSLLSEALYFNYGAYGITLIYVLYMSQDILIQACTLYILKYFIGSKAQIYALLSIPFLYFYNGQKGHSFKYFFYFYYPLHLLILYLIK